MSSEKWAHKAMSQAGWKYAHRIALDCFNVLRDEWWKHALNWLNNRRPPNEE